jgi:malate dehydrogenase
VRTIVVLGAGDLGGSLARHVAAADIAHRVRIVDEAGSVAAGKALDILQSAPIDGYSTVVEGTADESTVVDADAVVLADRFSEPAGEWQGDAGVALLRRVARLNPTALIVCAGARQIDVIDRAIAEGGVGARRVVGSAPEALRAAIVSLAALEAGCTPTDICLTVVGRPPHQAIVPWEDASIGGLRATDVLSPPAITRLDGRLARLWPPGPLTLAAAATTLLVAAATTRAQSISAFVGVTAREGARSTVAMLPVLMGPTGVKTVLAPTLSTRDRVRLDTVLQK